MPTVREGPAGAPSARDPAAPRGLLSAMPRVLGEAIARRGRASAPALEVSGAETHSRVEYTMRGTKRLPLNVLESQKSFLFKLLRGASSGTLRFWPVGFLPHSAQPEVAAGSPAPGPAGPAASPAPGTVSCKVRRATHEHCIA